MKYRTALLIALVVLPLAGAQAGRTVGDKITDTLSVSGIRFPAGCASIAEDLYDYVADHELDFAQERTQGFTFGAGSHVGQVVVDDGLQLHVETVLEKSPDLRVTFLNLDVDGIADGDFVVSHGHYSTPTMDCSFESIGGIADCTCSE